MSLIVAEDDDLLVREAEAVLEHVLHALHVVVAAGAEGLRVTEGC